MRRSISVLVLVSWLIPQLAHAQQPGAAAVPVEPAPAATDRDEAPPRYTALPAPGYEPGKADRLIRTGRGLTIGGGVMLGVGAALFITGIGLVAASVNEDQQCIHDRGSCGDPNPLFAGGVTALAIGVPIALGSIPLLIVGRYKVHKGERMHVGGYATASPLQIRF